MALVILAASLIGAFLAGRLVATPNDDAGLSTAPVLPATTPVRNGLLEEQITLAAVELTHAPKGTVTGRGGTVTSLLDDGSVVEEGDILLTVDLRPLVVLQGGVPMFRDLGMRDSGADVVQLQRALERLGFYGGETDGEVGSQTVRAWNDLLEVNGFVGGRTILHSEVFFVADLPARVDSTSVVVGDEASGLLANLVEVEPTIVAYVPALAVNQIAVGNLVEVLGEQEVIDGRVIGLSRVEAGSVAILVLDEPLEGNRTYRARIMNQPSGPGLVVPLTAIHTALDGSTYVSVLASGFEVIDVVVRIIDSSSTEALVVGDLVEGDELVVSQ